jgi:hypothetical protein
MASSIGVLVSFLLRVRAVVAAAAAHADETTPESGSHEDAEPAKQESRGSPEEHDAEPDHAESPAEKDWRCSCDPSPAGMVPLAEPVPRMLQQPLLEEQPLKMRYGWALYIEAMEKHRMEEC